MHIMHACTLCMHAYYACVHGCINGAPRDGLDDLPVPQLSTRAAHVTLNLSAGAPPPSPRRSPRYSHKRPARPCYSSPVLAPVPGTMHACMNIMHAYHACIQCVHACMHGCTCMLFHTGRRAHFFWRAPTQAAIGRTGSGGPAPPYPSHPPAGAA